MMITGFIYVGNKLKVKSDNMMQAFINKAFFFLFVFSLIINILLYNFIGFKYIDEICVVVLFALLLYSVIETPDWKFNKIFLVFLGVFFFYTCYSLWIGSNTKRGILSDLIIQMKPYLGFFCIYQLHPKLNLSQKKILKQILLSSWLVFLLPLGFYSMAAGDRILFEIMGHPIYYGVAVTAVSLCYFLLSDFTWKNRIIFLIMLSLGVFCGRSKFYGFLVMSIFIVVFFSSIKQFKMNLKTIMIVACMLVAMSYVAWDKIAFYFYDLVTGSSSVDEDMIARFMLYKTSPEILYDYFPFGSGLASYATYSSGLYYSNLYTEYGLDNIWGLSRSYYSFVGDTFYPSLAQFGVVGVVLFFLFWGYILRKAFVYYKNHPDPHLPSFIVAILIVGFLAIEATTGTTFTAQGGFFVMMLLGLVLADMKEQEKDYIHG